MVRSLLMLSVVALVACGGPEQVEAAPDEVGPSRAELTAGGEEPDTLEGLGGTYFQPLVGFNSAELRWVSLWPTTVTSRIDGGFARVAGGCPVSCAMESGTFTAIGINPAVGMSMLNLWQGETLQETYWIQRIWRSPLTNAIVRLRVVRHDKATQAFAEPFEVSRSGL